MAIEIEIEQNSSVELSRIGTSETHGEDSPYFAGWKAYDEDPYNESTNPSGVIQMGLAENQVSFDLLEEYLEENCEGEGNYLNSGFRENALFQDYHGLFSFRSAMGSFMEEIRGGRAKFDPNRVVLTAGATAANELLTFILANPGDALLVPTPYYPGNGNENQSKRSFNHKPIKSTRSNDPTVHNRRHSRFRYTQKHPSRIRRNLFRFRFLPDEFTSVAEVLESRGYKNAERVHIVYSLSKDLGLPGFRVGTIYSYNDKVVTTARRMSSFTLISSQTQRFLASMLSNRKFTENYIKMNRDRLKKRYEMIIEGLRTAGIECLEGNAGLFCWMNLSPLLKDKKTKEGEIEIWKRILKEVKLNISPGSSCHCSEPGWFRVCFANMSEKTLHVALDRIRRFMERMKKENEAN
ncbi:hypothetical protein Csa_007433 [Cucumis sativus]|nr:hypothetical protein Csa_007433 [Cucumis sativus]